MNGKFCLKIGDIEISYEGSQSFQIDDIANLMEKMSSLHKKHSGTVSSAQPSSTTQQKPEESGGSISYTTATIASRIGAKQTKDLAIAASAHLAFMQKRETFSRQDILQEMKKAVSIYNPNMSGNLSAALGKLLKDARLNEVRHGTYALTEREKESLKEKLS